MGRSETDRRRESANYWGNNRDTLVTVGIAVSLTSRAEWARLYGEAQGQ